MNKAYIAGKITGDPDFYAKFKAAEMYLKGRGFAVFSPAVMPACFDGFDYEDYMHVDFAMMWVCRSGVAFFLPDWQQSKGAMRERNNAILTGMAVEDLTWDEIGWKAKPIDLTFGDTLHG